MIPHPSIANRLRVRVGALVFDAPAGAVLLVEHAGIWPGEPTFWTPPGGEVQFGESLEEALRREVREETAVDVEVGPLRYTLDFIRPPLHAVSFYFQCEAVGAGEPAAGADPELGDEQLIRSVRFVPLAQLAPLVVYPDGLARWLAEDLPGGFAGAPRYVGPLR